MKGLQSTSFGFLLVLLFSITSCSEALKSDETKIEGLVTDFYSWYADQIKWGNNLAFQPDFTSDSNEVTALDFRIVEANLLEFGFHRDCVKEYKKEFSECEKNLQSITLDSLMNFEGIDEYENINCDFFNSYFWTKDMEAHDGVEVTSIKINGDNTAVAEGRIFNVAEKMRLFWEHKKINIQLVKEEDTWLIKDIDIIFL